MARPHSNGGDMAEVETFFSAWGMADADERVAAIRKTVAADAVYVDPRTDAPIVGPDALADYVAMFSQSAPGAVAEVVKSDTSGDMRRVTVAFKMPNGMEQMGQYFVEPARGNITRMTGFVGTGQPE